MTTLSQIIDVLIERAHSSNSAATISADNCSQVLGLGTSHDQVCHPDLAGNDKTPVNRLLDSALGALSGDYLHEEVFVQPQQQAALLLQLIPLILRWIKQQGGLSAALTVLQQKGLESQVASWTSAGVNERIMPEQLNDIFKQDSLEQLAQQHRVTLDTVRTGLATILPQMIDQLTSAQYDNGQISADIEINNILNRLVNL